MRTHPHEPPGAAGGTVLPAVHRQWDTREQVSKGDFAASADKKAGGGLRAADWLQGARTNTVVLSSMLQV